MSPCRLSRTAIDRFFFDSSRPGLGYFSAKEAEHNMRPADVSAVFRRSYLSLCGVSRLAGPTIPMGSSSRVRNQPTSQPANQTTGGVQRSADRCR